MQKSFPSLRESLQISGGMVSRVKSDEQYSMEVRGLSWLQLVPLHTWLHGCYFHCGSYTWTCQVQICEKDLKLLSILGSGASSKVYKALLCKQGQSTPPKFVAVKKISNLDEVWQHQSTQLRIYCCSLDVLLVCSVRVRAGIAETDEEGCQGLDGCQPCSRWSWIGRIRRPCQI